MKRRIRFQLPAGEYGALVRQRASNELIPESARLDDGEVLAILARAGKTLSQLGEDVQHLVEANAANEFPRLYE